MKILQVSEFNYMRGGAYNYFLKLSKKLEEEGNEVAVFSMHHPKNLPSKWSKYFVSRISFNEGGLRDKLLAPFRIWYSFEAKRKFEKLLKDFKPDIVHVHNLYHQISPSILPVARKYGIPVVMHLHDYKLICPNYQMLCGSRICEDCAAPNYYRCFLKKCFQNSYVKSLVVTIEMYLHHNILKIYEKNIDLYIAPSQFMKDVCVRHGVPEAKIKVIYNFVDDVVPLANKTLDDYVLYLGRLSAEKGIDVAINAIAQSTGSLKLKIAGEGSEEVVCRMLIKKLKLEQRVELTGHKSGTDLENLIAGAKAVVIPSVWYENMPFSMLEALALGKIVIASRIGGLPELVKDGSNGFLFTMGDSAALSTIFEKLSSFDIESMGRQARKSVSHLTIENHYKDIMSVYNTYVTKA